MAEKESFEKIIRRMAGIIDSMDKEKKAKNQKKVTPTEEKTSKVTPVKKETEEEKTQRTLVSRAMELYRQKRKGKKKQTAKPKKEEIAADEKETPVEKTKPEKTKEEKTQRTLVSRATELSRVYTKPSKVQEMHRRLRKGGKSFTRQGASKLIDKTDKITIYNMNKADSKKVHVFEEGKGQKRKKYEKDLTSGGSRGSALTATGGSRVEYETKPGDKPGKAWIKTSKIPSITKQMELYRQNRKRKKKGR